MLNLKRHLRSEKGFTMIEMMVVLIIIAVLIAGGIALYRGYINKAKITKAESFLSTAAAALDAYYEEYGGYPDDPAKAGVDVTVNDPWGKPYNYSTTGTSNNDGTYPGYTLETSHQNGVYVQAAGNGGNSKVTVQKESS